MLLLLKFIPLAFSALLPVINPVGSALLFLGLVGSAPESVYRSLARKIALNTVLLLITIDVGGAAILKVFGISLPVVQVAGGGVLAAMGWTLLNRKDVAHAEDVSETETPPNSRPIFASTFYPLTFPVTAGPGTIVVTLTLSAHASQRLLLNSLLAQAGFLIGIVLICVVVYLSYAYAPRITKRISSQTLHGITRIIAFILLCIGVQIAWNGVQGLIGTLPAH
jgi:multiple antibiotic resistance protein